jgi:hypothetical protein
MPWHVPKRQRRRDVLVGDGGPGQVGRAVGGEPIDAAGVYITAVTTVVVHSELPAGSVTSAMSCANRCATTSVLPDPVDAMICR